jgi:rRNA maturation protein Nop10
MKISDELLVMVPGQGYVRSAVFRLCYVRKPQGWSQSDIFGRCKWCGGFTIRGVCQKCGHAALCSYCKRVRQPNGNWKKVVIDLSSRMVSHSICDECRWIHYPDIALRIEQSKHRGMYGFGTDRESSPTGGVGA